VGARNVSSADIQVVKEVEIMLSITAIIIGLVAATAWQVLHAEDAKLTLAILNHGGYEKNPLIGKHPTPNRLKKFMAGFAVAHGVLSAFCLCVPAAQLVFIPFTLVSLAAKTYVVVHNKKILRQLGG